MSIDQHVNVTLAVNNAGIKGVGFGLVAVLTYKQLWSDRKRLYSSTNAAVLDGFPADSPEGLAITRAFAQSPHAKQVAVIRGTRPPTLRYALEASDVRDAFEYVLNVGGEGVTATEILYESTSDATDDENLALARIHNALLTQLNAVTGKNFTAAFEALVVADTTFVAEADDDTITTANALVNPDDDFTADNTTEIFTAVAHGLLTGDGPFQVSNSGGALPTGLLALTDYWIIKIDADTFYLATSRANALAGTHLSISTNGTGIQTISDTAETRRVVAHGLRTGDGPLRVSNAGGALPTGLVAATDYWVIRTGTYTFKLASTLALALAGTGLALTTDGTGVQTIADTASTKRPSEALTVTGDVAGDWFFIEVLDTTAVTSEMNHADPGIATDLAEIAVVDKNWYWLKTNYNSKAMVLAAAAWVESQPFKAYIAELCDTDCENLADDNNDVLDEVSDLTYKAVLPIYHRKPNQMIAAGAAGKVAALKPGAWTMAYQEIIGATADTFTDTQSGHLDDKRGTYYKTEADHNLLWEGKVGSTSYGFLDVKVALDFVVDGLQKRLFGVFYALSNSGSKVGYDDADIALLQRTAEGFIDLCKGNTYKIVAPGTPGSTSDPEPSVIFPKVEDIEPGTRALRELPDATINFRIVGAIHTLDITLTVTF